jgi:uncharacterized repeat protein (TIGR01451 family)
MGVNISKKMILFVITLFFTILVCGAVSAADADIQVNQTINNSAPQYNDNVKFTTTVSNNGPDNATGVQITNKLPAGLVYISDDSNGAYNPETGIWYIGDFNYGDSPKILNIITRVNATGTIKDIVNKTGQNEIDPNLDNNSQTTVLNIPKIVDVGVYQYAWYSSKYTYLPGETPVMVIDVRNWNTSNNYDDATGVIVEYIISDGFDYIYCDTRGVGTATYDALTRTITWYIGYMPKDSMAFMNVYLKTAKTGTFTNTARLKAVDQTDVTPNNNQRSRTIVLGPTSADIEVDQNVNTTTPNYQDEITITITTTNNGPDNATGVQITDQLPAGLTYISHNTTTGTYDPTTGIWNIGNLNNGENAILTIIAKINTTGTIKNLANKTSATPTDDWNHDNNAKTIIITPQGSSYSSNVDVGVYQYAWYSSKYTYLPGETPVMVIDVRNWNTSNNYDDATGVIVEYIISDGFDYIYCDTRGVGTATYDALTRTITWYIGYMPKDSMAFMNVYLKTAKTGTFTNTARLKAVDQTDVTPNNNQRSRTIVLGPTSADIEVDQNVNTTTPNYQDEITITITTTNNGPDNATGVQITDQLPAGLTYISHNTTTGTYDPTTGIWNIGNLNNGENAILTIIAKINTTGTIKNLANKTSATPTDDWNHDNNAKTIVMTVCCGSDIGVDQTISNTTPNYLDTVTVTVYAKNYGCDYATNVQITDLLAPGLEYISHTTNHGTFANGVWTINNLQCGQEAVLTIIARVIQACVITNTVTRSGGSQYDYNPLNDVKSVDLNVVEAAYVEVNKSATPSNPNYHDTVTYTITATNKGPDNATGVNINYGLPSGLTLIGSSATRGSYSNGVWNIGNLANGETVTLTITALINATGTITDNSLTVTQDQYKWNNTLPVPINWNIPQSADIQVTQTVNNTTPTAETNVNFSITTKNNGPNNASGVQVTSKLPTGFTVLSWKVSRDGGLTWTNNDGSYNSNTGLWTIGALNNAATFILNITARTPAQMGNFTNNATKTAETQYDWNSNNNAQNVSLAVTGTIPDDIFTNDGKQSGTVNTDDGSTTAITLPFTITLYGQTYNTIYISVNGAIGLGAPIQGPYYYLTPESNTANRYVAYIAPFWADFDVEYIGSITYTITNNQVNITWYRVPCHSDNRDSNNVNTVTLILTNESTYGFIYGNLNWKNDPSDSYPSYARISKGDNGATYKNFWTGDQELSEIANKSFWFDSNGNLISGAADIGVTQSAGANTIHLYWGSNTTTLTITVTNNGPNTATGVQIKEVLDSHISYRSHTASSGTSYNSSTGIWNIGTLASGESKTLVITVGANSSGSGASTATKTAETQYDPVSTNNDASATIRVTW